HGGAAGARAGRPRRPGVPGPRGRRALLPAPAANDRGSRLVAVGPRVRRLGLRARPAEKAGRGPDGRPGGAAEPVGDGVRAGGAARRPPPRRRPGLPARHALYPPPPPPRPPPPFAAAPAGRAPASDDGAFFCAPGDPPRNKAGVAGTAHRGRERFASYGSTTADGLRALLACGLPRDGARVTAARHWLAE